MKNKKTNKKTLAYKIRKYNIQDETALLFFSIFLMFLAALYFFSNNQPVDDYDKFFGAAFAVVASVPLIIPIRFIVKKIKKS